MNTQQQHLLKLLKEIDEICRENDITYYAAGGTVIGAARHKGFIPWDDDVDIYMTKENFEAFRGAFKKAALPDRKLEYIKDNPEFYATIPRYNEETTTQICRYHILGKASGGLLIDILIMDEFPDNEDERHEYLAKLNVYADLVALPYTHAQRNEDKYLGYYDKYIEKIKAEGRNSVLQELEEELFSFDSDSCSCYILRWAALPIILPKNMMGEPVKLRFEDMYVPVPQDWFGYLALLYGSDWINVPYTDGQETHIAISNMEVPYKLFMEERDRYISQNKAMRLYIERKRRSVDLQYARRPIEKYILELKVKIAKKIIEKQIYNKKEKIHALYCEKSYSEILEIFKYYIECQTMTLFAGKLKHAQWNRWVNPTVIEIEEWALRIVLMSLVMSGNDKKASKIVGLYYRAGKENSIVQEIKAVIEKINNIERLYYSKRYSECITEIEAIVDFQSSTKCKNYYWLCKAIIDDSKETGENIKKLLELEDTSVEIQKAYGDYLYAKGLVDEAENVYTNVMKQTRNGMFWQDIYEKTGAAPDILACQPSVIDSIEEREAALLDEVHELCEKNDIEYVLSGYLTARALNGENPGSSVKEKNIYMNIENAMRFVDVFEKSGIAGRELLSFNNCSSLIDFKLIYNDKDSVFLRFDRINEWEGVGAHINIIILRRRHKSLLIDKYILLKEIVLSVVNIHPVDKGVLRKKMRKLLYLIAKIYVNIVGKQKYSKKLYNHIVKRETAYIGTDTNYFYRKNKTKNIYTDKTIAKEVLEERKKIFIGEKSYYASAIYADKDWKFMPESPVEESLFAFSSTDINWRELRDIMDYKEYYSLDWQTYGIKRRALSSINKKVQKMWLIMKRSEDKLLIYNAFEPKVNNLRLLYENQSYDDIQEIFKDYEEKFLFYRKNKLTFFVNRELSQMFSNYLENTGREKLASVVIKQSERIKEYDEIWDFKEQERM